MEYWSACTKTCCLSCISKGLSPKDCDGSILKLESDQSKWRPWQDKTWFLSVSAHFLWSIRLSPQKILPPQKRLHKTYVVFFREMLPTTTTQQLRHQVSTGQLVGAPVQPSSLSMTELESTTVGAIASGIVPLDGEFFGTRDKAGGTWLFHHGSFNKNQVDF